MNGISRSHLAKANIPISCDQYYDFHSCPSIVFDLPMRHVQPEGCGSIDSALLGLRYLSMLSGIFAKHASPESNRFACSQQAPESNVQSVAGPSSGCVLLAHPMHTYALLCSCIRMS